MKKNLIFYFIFIILLGFSVNVGALHAGAPIGMGPGGKVDLFDWYNATASGCSPSSPFPALMCVGGAASSKPQGDTYYFSAWLPNASQLPVTTGLPLVGTFNDGTSQNCNGNLALMQLAAFDWSNRNASKISEVNCMSGYSPGSNVPAGWFAHCTSGDDGVGNTCGWKTRSPLSKGGLIYLPMERQIGSGAASAHDSTVIVSPDSGAHWCNPYTVTNRAGSPGCDSSNWSATGDAPKCGAASGTSGVQCLDAAYAGGMMWHNMPASVNGTPIYNWNFYQYGQDGSLPANIGGDCDPATYTCAMLDDGSIARVLNTDLPSLDVTKWQYVASTDAQSNPTWTSTFTSRKSVIAFSPNSDNDLMKPRGILSAPVYIKEFKSYILTGFKYGPSRVEFLSSPSAFGPFKPIGIFPGYIGFNAANLGIGYTVVSTNPPHVQITVVADEKSFAGAGGGVPTFQKFDLVLGPQYGGVGDVPSYLDTSMGKVNSGWQFTSGEEPGTFIRKGLIWAFDFMDHGGVTASTYQFFHDVANGGAVMSPCFTDGATNCNDGIMGLKGLSLLTNGIRIQDGYSARYESNISDINRGTTAGNQNAPSVMQGNGTYSVVGIYKLDSIGYTTSLWITGNPSDGNASVGLTTQQTTGYMGIDWGNVYTFRWAYRSAFAPIAGNWYFMSATVTAGSPPTAKLWVGGAVTPGVLTDVISGVSRTKNGGTPATVPAVSAGPLVLENDGSGHIPNASYAGLMLYNRALSDTENQQLYQSFKIKMKERNIIIQ
ncbi:hypothetical protein HY311_03940 [Candidatus Nomurabacteria bacterium]|nr:hypothetical protein [Candidatus Nomurabacteria bacterium]